MKRREFMRLAGAGAVAPWLAGLSAYAAVKVPSYLKGYETLYAQNPRAAALQWFREARFGLFIHWGCIR